VRPTLPGLTVGMTHTAHIQPGHDGVQRAPGRASRDFAGCAAKATASGVWSTR